MGTNRRPTLTGPTSMSAPHPPPTGVLPVCPVTKGPFYKMVAHPELGVVPVYGARPMARTIPMATGAPGDETPSIILTAYCYDDMAGRWCGAVRIPVSAIRAVVPAPRGALRIAGSESIACAGHSAVVGGVSPSRRRRGG
jgi:hypothetical protein